MVVPRDTLHWIGGGQKGAARGHRALRRNVAITNITTSITGIVTSKITGMTTVITSVMTDVITSIMTRTTDN